MSMNIKSPEAHRLALELAKATGQTVTAAVTEALHVRLEQVQTPPEKTGMVERLMEISERAAAHWPEHLRNVDVDTLVDDLLYDEMGMPSDD